MFFKNLKKNQPAANVDQQSTIQSTPESTLCVELSDEELCAVNGGGGGTCVYILLATGQWGYYYEGTTLICTPK